MTQFILQYWIGVGFGLIVSVFGILYKRLSQKVQKEIAEQNALKYGVQALLRDRIIKVYNDYTERGYCPIYAKENATSLYNQYHALGGNGAVTNLYKAIMSMPTIKGGEKIVQ